MTLQAPATVKESARVSCSPWSSLASVIGHPSWARGPDQALSVFETTEWFSHLARACPDLGATAFLLHIEDPQCSSFMALRRSTDGSIESLSNYYASLYGVVTNDRHAALDHARQYGEWLARSNAPTIRLHPLDADAEFNRMLTEALRKHRWVDPYFAFGNWYHPCTGTSWKDYLAARPSRLRNTIMRTRKKLLAEPTFQLCLTDSSSHFDAVEACIEAFQSVYGRSWKEEEPHPLFVPGFFRFAHEKGWLRLGVAYMDGQAVAAQAWTVKAGIASIYKLAYDTQYGKRGVGTVLSAALSEHVLDQDHVGEIDFLTGDDPYKAEWMDKRRERIGILAFHRRSPKGLYAASRHFGGRWLRKLRAGNDVAAPTPLDPPAEQ